MKKDSNISNMTTDIITNTPEETQKVAEALVSNNPDITVMALHGDLGAGKTCFVQGVAAALDINEPITSPTFTIVNEYSGSRGLVHIDLYRMQSPDEVIALGFEEFLSSGSLLAIEWPDRAEELLPEGTVHVHFTTNDKPNQRTIEIRK
ncbi:tRNA (adenosine(37)-N6)-threonylcarbamoyltransferase complex ATPase subunit type 1 TsaE [bacterium E08(2017)]|nr:tRNA (adenosine(37)-N6)-threonylcarbamoyltransferase complex ATPase subunit type 1 TsaE [bacterium E08(2017)]